MKSNYTVLNIKKIQIDDGQDKQEGQLYVQMNVKIENIYIVKMDQQILGGEEDFQMVVDSSPQSPDDLFFNQIVQALQQIVVDQYFQKNQAGFMRKNCQIFENVEQNKMQYMPVFKNYQQVMGQCLDKMLAERVGQFQMSRFIAMLPKRVNQIDEEIYQILTSLTDFEVFKELMLDYKSAHEDEIRLKTIKSVKVPEHKKIQGANDNIFGNSKAPTFGNDPLVKKKPNQPSKKEKSEQQILVPDFVLTIRPLRKG